MRPNPNASFAIPKDVSETPFIGRTSQYPDASAAAKIVDARRRCAGSLATYAVAVISLALAVVYGINAAAPT
jgi:hypothetical protein